MPDLIKAKSSIKWHYDLIGEGEILLFLHGWGVDHRIWRQQIKYFSRFYKILSIDLPGHGNSSWERISFEEMAEDIVLILQQLNIDKIILVGSSLGGLLGLKIYAIVPERFKQLIFVGSLPKFSKASDYPYGLDIDKIRKLSSQLNSDYPSIINIFFRSLFTNEERRTRRFHWIQRFRRTEGFPTKQALVEYLDILENEDLRFILRNVRIPVYFINGKEDTICPMASSIVLKELCPQARFSFFDQCGHFPFLSKPYEFNQVLEQALKEKNDFNKDSY